MVDPGGAAAEGLPAVDGLRWLENGQAALAGGLLTVADQLDAMFVRMARRWSAEEHRYPILLSVRELDRIDYFRSFPHLATFAVCLDADADNLRAFATGEPVSADGTVKMTNSAPIAEILTPAACYHLYIDHRDRTFELARYFTTKNTCFRREEEYRPLERQWSFTMREIVMMGTAEEARTFFDEAAGAAGRLAAALGLPVDWATATDPFFQPTSNPQYLMQRIDPTKHELVFGNGLAIASANLHHDHFGRAYNITRTADEETKPVHTACLAFGIERWLAALARQFGPAPSDWPAIADLEV